MQSTIADKLPAKEQDQYVLRFDRAGHREAIKAEAKKNRRSLNKQLLILIEAGERATRAQGAQQ